MRGSRFARLVAWCVAPASVATAFAQPAERARRPSPGPVAPRPPSASAQAYLSGVQPLVGLHAPSNDPVMRDAAGRTMLVLRTVNHGESLALRATTDAGDFSSVDLDRASHLLRAAGGQQFPVDPRALTLLYRIQTRFDVSEIRVVSAYRVARAGSNSNHGKGRAVDLIVPGAPDAEVASFARGLGFVGVGVYPASQFVHVDVRPRSYFWVDFSGPHSRNRERRILGDLAMKSDADALAIGRTPVEPFAIGADVDAALRNLGQSSTAMPPEDDGDDEN
jgi:uncharacterized protein YcbK (DUF882 family)